LLELSLSADLKCQQLTPVATLQVTKVKVTRADGSSAILAMKEFTADARGPEFAGAAAVEMQRELAMLERVAPHPNVVHLAGTAVSGSGGNHCAILTELCDGTLSDILKRTGRFSLTGHEVLDAWDQVSRRVCVHVCVCVCTRVRMLCSERRCILACPGLPAP
jgi:hypothetical protein